VVSEEKARSSREYVLTVEDLKASAARADSPKAQSAVQARKVEDCLRQAATAPGAGGDAGTDQAARYAAWLQRKEARKEARAKRSGSSLDRGAFLSGVPEVEADIAYRFSFIVVGASAERIVEAACGSRAAHSLPGAGLENREDPGNNGPTNGGSPERQRSNLPKAYRCLCNVSSQLAAQASKEQPQLAKLAFQVVMPGEDTPACTSRAEALNTVLAFVILLDAGSSGGPRSLQGQLQAMAETVQRSRQLARPRRRPVRAVLLCENAGTLAMPEAQWGSALAKWEEEHGYLWKFGPLSWEAADSWHATFTEMASVRLLANRTGKGLGDANAPTDDEAGGGEDDVADTEQDLLQSFTKTRSRASVASDNESCTSEGFMRPPVFEAEYDGSACSESALELHRRLDELT